MIISDLNYLEVVDQETSVVGGFDPSYAKFKEVVDINKYVNARVNIKGHVATAENEANAFGSGTLAETFTSTLTTPYSSSSSGTSISATSY